MSVKVSAYTDDGGAPEVNLALSKEQAETIVRYLWMRGINTRLLTASGKGGVNKVSNSSYYWGRDVNNRIEITLEKLPITGMF
jgi:outer membrane protein OmpA-like peptidoglycan-associated protein